MLLGKKKVTALEIDGKQQVLSLDCQGERRRRRTRFGKGKKGEEERTDLYLQKTLNRQFN